MIQQQSQSATSGQIILVNTVYTTPGQVWRVSNPYTVTLNNGGTYWTPSWDSAHPYSEHQHDALGREIKTITADPAISQTMAYNQWTTTLTDANGHQHQTLADAFGRTVTVKEYNQGAIYTTQYVYNVLNKLTTVTDASNTLASSLTYDSLGRKTAMYDYDMGNWSYGYDSAGNLTRQTDNAGQTTCLYYDALNRLKGKNYQINNSVCPSVATSYAITNTYDTGANGIGQRTRLDDASGYTTWGYDKQGRVLTQTQTISNTAFTTSWTYDAMSRVRTMTYPVDNETVTTTYNAQGLPATLSGLTNYVTASWYNPVGQLTSLSFGNNVTTNYTYDTKTARLTQLTTTNSLQDLRYQYDKVGNIKSITDTLRSETTTFTYDDLDRLLSASIPGMYSQGWTYNSIGNILTRTGVDAATFSYNDAAHKHAVTQVGSAYYCYDANGNLYKSGATNSSCSSGGNALSYDTENHLTQVISGTVTTQYFYNADGARVKKIVGGVSTYYVGNYYEVTSGAVTKYYYFGAQRVAMRNTNGVTYLHGDHLGSTSATSGAQTSKQWYHAYGGVRATEGTLPTDYTFTGQKADSDGLSFYNARYYDAYLNRFIQPDSIIPNFYNPQYLNRYSYVRNNPVRYTDPSGHFVPLVIFGVVLVAVGIGALINEVSQINNYAQQNGIGFWEAAASPQLKLDQGQMVTSGAEVAVITLTALETAPLALGEAALLANNTALWRASGLGNTPVMPTGTNSDAPYQNHYTTDEGYKGILEDKEIRSNSGTNFFTTGESNNPDEIRRGLNKGLYGDVWVPAGHFRFRPDQIPNLSEPHPVPNGLWDESTTPSPVPVGPDIPWIPTEPYPE